MTRVRRWYHSWLAERQMFGLGLVELAILGALFLLVVGIVTAIVVARASSPRE